MRMVLTALLVLAASPSAAQGEGGAPPPASVAEAVTRAVSMGHGETCTVSGAAAPSGGVYPCLDIGPYRFVEEYGIIRGYVLVKDASPFPILHIPDGRLVFDVGGPWVADLEPRVAEWWADVVEGGGAARAALEKEQSKLKAAETSVVEFGAQKREPPAPPDKW